MKYQHMDFVKVGTYIFFSFLVNKSRTFKSSMYILSLFSSYVAYNKFIQIHPWSSTNQGQGFNWFILNRRI